MESTDNGLRDCRAWVQGDPCECPLRLERAGRKTDVSAMASSGNCVLSAPAGVARRIRGAKSSICSRRHLETNLQLNHIVSDITGATGLRIIRAFGAKEQDPAVLAANRDVLLHRDDPG